MFQLSQTSYNRLKGIDQRLIDIVTMAIITSPIDFGIPQDGGLRTVERQKELFDLKKSKCDGYKNKSYHQSGRAFDIYAYVDKKASWDRAHLKTIADHLILVAKRDFDINLEWGGNFKGFVDMPHFQIK
ncbi:MAG: hypothetical protein UR61_C0047G0004 [candidate division WS6 bacterium GW2011_GWE1_34_7]|uniref:Peptidase M15C domain-containing protein n=1 Tax=candidate division WS6 bacterium GW2011_GWE1_34_7 TaxID=1619093 RepID=A0A0G0EAE7_9BACT|nr:MAG: hypothetical protein UR61_C0047G0004 [candidate division WS6 bacterium GW2011_GWE1_34_7]